MNTTEQLENAREIDDLNSQIANLRMQLTHSENQNRILRVQTVRYEAILGIEERA